MAPVTNQPLDVLVVGAGQAGLALGQELRQTTVRYLIVDAHQRIGDNWRQRFDSLELFTPRAYSALPGLPLEGDPDGYPTKDELADYLERYATQFELPVATGSGVVRLEHRDGLFQATTTRNDSLAAQAVVIATGAFQQPVVPPIATLLDPQVTQLTAESYRNPSQVPEGTVLVVGDGATGRQIARELSESGRSVVLATGRSRRVSPDRILGKSVFWWMGKLGVLRASSQSRIGRKLQAADPFPGKHLELNRLRDLGIAVVGRLEQAAGREVVFSTGETHQVDAVVWAAGYRDRTDWVQVPGAVDAHGRFVEERGVSPVPGLFHIGRSWQTSRGSALVTGVGADAAMVARQLMHTPGRAGRTTPTVQPQSTASAPVR